MKSSKTGGGKSPRRPITKEVFPYDMERKKTAGSVMHKPTSSSGTRGKKGNGYDRSKGLLAKGTTVKSTPKTITKKAPLKAKENMSTNRLRSKNQGLGRVPNKPKTKKTQIIERNAAIAIQRWWKGIMSEQQKLREKLIAARQALNELKQKRLLRESSSNASPSKRSEQDLSIINVDSPSNKRIIDIHNSGSKRDSEVMQTADFGKFKLEKEPILEMR
jgi:hypothetical protein